MVDYLSRVVTNREALNDHIRELQSSALREAPDGGETQLVGQETWEGEDLETVLENGLDVLSDLRLGFLRYNSIALFELFDAINESLPSCWMDLVMADAERLWDSRPSRDQ